MSVLQASGGSGNYTWTSSNATVATVSADGIVVAGSYIGHTKIRASDTRNRKHYDMMQVRPSSDYSMLSCFSKIISVHSQVLLYRLYVDVMRLWKSSVRF